MFFVIVNLHIFRRCSSYFGYILPFIFSVVGKLDLVVHRHTLVLIGKLELKEV